MTTLFGWCFGPEGSTGDHDSCPYELGAGGSILRCGCACHEGSEKSRIFNQARGNDVSPWDNESPTKDGPGDSLLAQRAEVPGPRPTRTRSAEL